MSQSHLVSVFSLFLSFFLLGVDPYAQQKERERTQKQDVIGSSV